MPKEKKIGDVYAKIKKPVVVSKRKVAVAPKSRMTRAMRAVNGEGAYMQRRKQI